MKIVKHKDIDKDIKLLGKKFRTPEESLDSWIRLFEVKGSSEMTGMDRYSGMFSGHDVYKARVIPLKEKCGKSRGYRLLFEIRGDLCIILFFSRHGMYKSEKDLIKMVKYRISTFENEGLQGLTDLGM